VLSFPPKADQPVAGGFSCHRKGVINVKVIRKGEEIAKENLICCPAFMFSSIGRDEE
jgi:hypothetical protein